MSKYSRQFKGECIEMVIGLGMSSQEVGMQMNVTYQSVDNWIKQHHKGIALVRSHNTIDIITKTWKS